MPLITTSQNDMLRYYPSVQIQGLHVSNYKVLLRTIKEELNDLRTNLCFRAGENGVTSKVILQSPNNFSKNSTKLLRVY